MVGKFFETPQFGLTSSNYRLPERAERARAKDRWLLAVCWADPPYHQLPANLYRWWNCSLPGLLQQHDRWRKGRQRSKKFALFDKTFWICRSQSRLPVTTNSTLQSCSRRAPMVSNVGLLCCSRTSVQSRKSRRNSRTSLSCLGLAVLSSTTIWLSSTWKALSVLRYLASVCLRGMPTDATSVTRQRSCSRSSKSTLLWFQEDVPNSFRFVFDSYGCFIRSPV